MKLNLEVILEIRIEDVGLGLRLFKEMIRVDNLQFQN